MFFKRSGFYVLFFLFFSFTAQAQVDYAVGNIRIVVEDYNGAISLYRKITPIANKSEIEKNEETQNNIRIEGYKGAAGTKFGALPESSYVVPHDDSKDFYWEPLLDAGRYTSNSAYYVLLDTGIYKLNRSAAISISSSVDTINNTVSIIYDIKDKIEVVVDMHVFASSSDFFCDSIRVEITMQNLSKKRSRVALKGVFDTCLGENTKAHFSSATTKAINSEMFFDAMADEKWICSQNSIASIKFLLSGNTITSPQNVIMSNKDVFASQLWIPNVKTGRRFDSLFSYNNSALSIIWSPFYLDFDKTATVRFYITTAEQGDNPSELFTNMADLGISNEVKKDATQIIDADYVSRLLARINQLKQNPSKADAEEIKYLTTEVENILQQMEQ